MNLVKLSSHTVDLDLLPERPVVLDVGCRGFDFTREVLALRRDSHIIAMDPDPLIAMPFNLIGTGASFCRAALLGDGRRTANYAGWSTGEGNLICDVSPHYAERSHQVDCIDIRTLMVWLDIFHWDLVKLDCEESEFGILEVWPGPIATQISVEFHDWTGPWETKAKNSPDYYPKLWAGPLRDYEVVQHELSKVGEGTGHWDTLLRLKRK